MDTQALALRVPPHSIEAEASVLGGLLLDNSAWEKIGDMVRPNDFYRADHRVIFESIAKLIDGGRPADVVTVYEALQSIGRADEVGVSRISTPSPMKRPRPPIFGAMRKLFVTDRFSDTLYR